MSFLFSSNFGALLDKATSENLVIRGNELNLDEFLQVADYIKSGQVKCSTAMLKIKGRLKNTNPNVQLLTLDLLDICIKNCGADFVSEAVKAENLRPLEDILMQIGVPQLVKLKILEYIQSWAIALQENPKLEDIKDCYSRLKASGYHFPPAKNAIVIAGLFETRVPPKWAESDACFRCRTRFTTTNRRHHCRECGESFCDKCSSRRIALPHFGFSDPQRACEGCYTRLQAQQSGSLPASDAKQPNSVSEDDKLLQEAIRQSLALQGSADKLKQDSKVSNPSKESDDDIKFMEDMKRAIEQSMKADNESLTPATAADGSKSSVKGTATLAVQTASYQLSDLEVGNVRLFAQIVEKYATMGPAGANQLLYDQQTHQLRNELAALKANRLKALQDQIRRKLDYYLNSYEQLNQCNQLYDQLLEQRLQLHQTRGPSASSLISGALAPNGGHSTPYSSQPILAQHGSIQPLVSSGATLGSSSSATLQKPDEPLIQL